MIYDYFDCVDEIYNLYELISVIPQNASLQKVEREYPEAFSRLKVFSLRKNLPLKSARRDIIQIYNYFDSSEEWNLYTKVNSKESAADFIRFESKGRGVYTSTKENIIRNYFSKVLDYWTQEENESWQSFMYRIIHNMDSIPKCIYCEERAHFVDKNKGFSKTCEAHQNQYMSDVTKNLSEEVKVAKLAKRRATSLEKYGVDDPNRSREVREKLEQTNLKRYGVKYTTQAESVKKKKEETFIRKYGVDNPMKNKEIREKVSKSNHDTYMENWEEKQLKGNWKDKSPETIAILKDPEVFRQTVLDHYDMSVKQLADFIGISSQICLKHLHQLGFENFISKSNSYSQPEEDIVNYVKELLPTFNNDEDIIRNCRNIISPKELDIYIPSLNLAIEFNGNYWHSLEKVEEKGGKYYHQNKSLACKDKGVKLLHIYEVDWINDKEFQLGIIKEFLYQNFKPRFELKDSILHLKNPISQEELNSINPALIILPFEFGYYDYKGYEVKELTIPQQILGTSLYNSGNLIYQKVLS